MAPGTENQIPVTPTLYIATDQVGSLKHKNQCIKCTVRYILCSTRVHVHFYPQVLYTVQVAVPTVHA